MSHPYVNVLQTYMAALEQSDYVTIEGLFSAEGKVRSPFFGEMPAAQFYNRLGEVSVKNAITPIDIFLSESGKPHATAYFQYDWAVRDGSVVSFKVMDLFTFDPLTANVKYLELIYDTHPLRMAAKNN